MHFQKKLDAATVPLIESAGGKATLIDLADYEMPIYNGDLEAASRLQGLIVAHDALLIATPEYNGSMTPVVLNTLDWCSRPDQKTPAGSRHCVVARCARRLALPVPSARFARLSRHTGDSATVGGRQGAGEDCLKIVSGPTIQQGISP